MAFEIYIRKGTSGVYLINRAGVHLINANQVAIDGNYFAELTDNQLARDNNCLFLLQVALFSCYAQ